MTGATAARHERTTRIPNAQSSARRFYIVPLAVEVFGGYGADGGPSIRLPRVLLVGAGEIIGQGRG